MEDDTQENVVSEQKVTYEATSDEKTWAMVAHLASLFVSFIGPLVVWLIKKDELPLVDDQGKESLNFQITVALAQFVSVILVVVTFGLAIPLPIAVGIGAMVLTIIAAIKAYEGERYRYPFCIRFIK